MTDNKKILERKKRFMVIGTIFIIISILASIYINLVSLIAQFILWGLFFLYFIHSFKKDYSKGKYEKVMKFGIACSPILAISCIAGGLAVRAMIEGKLIDAGIYLIAGMLFIHLTINWIVIPFAKNYLKIVKMKG